MPRKLGQKNREIEARKLGVLQNNNSTTGSSRIITVPNAAKTTYFYLDVPTGYDFLKVSTGSTPGETNLFYIQDNGTVKNAFLDNADSVGAVYEMHGVYTSPTDGNVNGLIRVRSRSDTGADPIIADVYFTNEDVTNGNELGNISIVLQESGADVMPMRIKGNDVLIGAGSTLTDTPNHELEVVGDIGYQGDLQSLKNSTTYEVYGFHPLTSPLTSTSYDGDSFSDTAKTLIDMSAVFGAPAGARAYLFNVVCRDSGSAATNTFVVLSPNNTANEGPTTGPHGRANDTWERGTLTVPADSNGDVYIQIEASGSNTFELYLQVWGYWI